MIRKFLTFLLLLVLIVLPLTGQEAMNDFWYSACAGYSQLEFSDGSIVCVDSFSPTDAIISVGNLKTGESRMFTKKLLEPVPSGTPRLHPDRWYGQHDESAGVSWWVLEGTQGYIVYEALFIEDEDNS